MNKAVMISAQPKVCERIANGKQTMLLTKTKPRLEAPFKGYIYCTKDANNHLFFSEEVFDGKKGKYAIPHIGNGKVVIEFVCDEVLVFVYGNMDIPYPAYDGDDSVIEIGDGYYITCGEFEQTCLTDEELDEYGKGKTLYGLHLTEVKTYDKPKKLEEFRKPCKVSCYNCKNPKYNEGACEEKGWCKNTCPPQSWKYVEELKNGIN